MKDELLKPLMEWSLSHQIPHMSAGYNDDVKEPHPITVMEWRNEEKRLVVYFEHKVIALRSWGSDMMNEMSEHEIVSSVDLQNCFDWLSLPDTSYTPPQNLLTTIFKWSLENGMPLINGGYDESTPIPVVEWWKGKKEITLYFDNVPNVLKSWGPSINDHMSDQDIHNPQELQECLDWMLTP